MLLHHRFNKHGVSFPQGEPRQSKSKETKTRKRAAKPELQTVERKQSTQPPSVQSVDSDGSVGDRIGDEPQKGDEKKVVREQDRRFANNARERFVFSSNNVFVDIVFFVLSLRCCFSNWLAEDSSCFATPLASKARGNHLTKLTFLETLSTEN